MKVLILGGTRFVGRHIAEALLAAGHDVSVFARGVSPDALPAQVERLRGDRDEGAPGLKALAGRSWDACIDTSGYTPRQVRPGVEQLRDRVGRYLFVSAVSVYGDPQQRPVRESQPRQAPAAEHVTEVNGETYGALKVACEDIVGEAFAERSTVLRPQIVVGPHDPTVGYTWWVQRAVRGGAMLAPGDGSDHVQVIDARDLGRFAVRVIENSLGGAFNLSGPRLTWAAFMAVLGAPEIVWVPNEILEAADLKFGELPLFRPERGYRSGLMDVSHERALAAGLTLTAPERTAHDVRAWLRNVDPMRALAPERERALIEQAVAARRPPGR